MTARYRLHQGAGGGADPPDADPPVGHHPGAPPCGAPAPGATVRRRRRPAVAPATGEGETTDRRRRRPRREPVSPRSGTRWSLGGGVERRRPRRGHRRPVVADRGPPAVRPASAPVSSMAGACFLRASASRAAPRATTCFGWASTTVGRPKASDTICATSGIREEPPTRSTADSSRGGTWAARSVPVERADRRLDRCPDHALELGPVERDLEVPVGQEHRDRGLGVDRERLLGQRAVLAQPGQGDDGLRVAHVELGQRAAGDVVDVDEDRPRRSRRRRAARCPPGSRGSRSRAACCAARWRRTCRRRGRRRR